MTEKYYVRAYAKLLIYRTKENYRFWVRGEVKICGILRISLLLLSRVCGIFQGGKKKAK